jgi:hypothetical protein
MIPAAGIAVALPIVKVVAVVLGGKLLPVIVTISPVEADRGVMVKIPLGTVIETCLVLFSLFAPCGAKATVSCMTDALSVTVTYRVPAVTVVGSVTVPTPVPSAPNGKT